MKKHDNITVNVNVTAGVALLALIGVALLALIGAVKVVQTACALTALALVYWGGWDMAEATQTAPVILAALAGGLVLISKGLLEEDDSYTEEAEHRDV